MSSPTDLRDAMTRAEAYPLDIGDETVLFSGRIDRVDLREDAARIVDYKTSSTPEARAIREGQAIQLSIYALALEEFLAPGVDCAEAHYVPVGKKRWAEGLAKAKGAWEERAALARRRVAESVAGIRAGWFAPAPSQDQCARCMARRPCRYEAGRIERKSAGRDESNT
jgi:RecB family exonuclease